MYASKIYLLLLTTLILTTFFAYSSDDYIPGGSSLSLRGSGYEPSDEPSAGTFGEVVRVEPFIGRSISIDGEVFFFTDQEKYDLFQRRYGNRPNCLNQRTSARNCECQQLLFQAKLSAQENAALIRSRASSPSRARASSLSRVRPSNLSQLERYRELSEKMNRYRNLEDKLTEFARYANRLAQKSLAGNQCRPFGQNNSQLCRSRRRTSSCGCYEKWVKENLNYITGRMRSQLRQMDLGRSNPITLVKSAVGLLNNCQAIVANPSPPPPCPPPAEMIMSQETQPPPQLSSGELLPAVPTQAAQQIKDLTLRQQLCGDNYPERQRESIQALRNFLNGDIESYSGSTMYRDLESLGDLKWCLSDHSNFNETLETKITGFSEKFGSPAAYSYACQYSGLTAGNFCSTVPQLHGQMSSRHRHSCNTQANGFVVHPPFDSNHFPTPYQSFVNARSTTRRPGIEIKDTPECREFMEKCQELSESVTISDNKSESFRSIIDNFLTPFSIARYEEDGELLPQACLDSTEGLVARVKAQALERILNTDVRPIISGAYVGAVKNGVKVIATATRHPVFVGLNTFLTYGGDQLVELTMTLSQDLLSGIRRIKVGEYNRDGTRRTEQEMEEAYNEEYNRQIQDFKRQIVPRIKQQGCGYAEGNIPDWVIKLRDQYGPNLGCEALVDRAFEINQ